MRRRARRPRRASRASLMARLGRNLISVAVRAGGEHEHTLLGGGGGDPRHGGRIRITRYRVGEFDREHRADAAHIADDRIPLLQLEQCGLQHALDAARLGEQVAADDLLKHRDGGRARNGVAAEGAAEPASVCGVHDLGAPDDAGEGHAARDALRGRDEVGHDAEVLRSRRRLLCGRHPTAPRRRRRRCRWRGTSRRARAGSPSAGTMKPPSP